MQQNLFVYNQNTGNVILIKPTARKKKTAGTQNSVTTGAPQQSQLPKEKHTENWEVTTLLRLPRPFCNTSTTTEDMRKMTDKKGFETGSHENLEGGNRAQLLFFITVWSGGGGDVCVSLERLHTRLRLELSPPPSPKEAATQRRDTLATTSTPGFETSLQHRF